MDFYWELYALFSVWLALVILTGYWIVRILVLLDRQRRAEKAYRLHLAVAMGRAVREAAIDDVPTASQPPPSPRH